MPQVKTAWLPAPLQEAGAELPLPLAWQPMERDPSAELMVKGRLSTSEATLQVDGVDNRRDRALEAAGNE